MLRKACAAAVALCTAVACLAQPPHLSFSLKGESEKPVTITITGKVLDGQTKKPLSGALVRGHIFVFQFTGPDIFDQLPHDETKSADDGSYTLKLAIPATAVASSNACVCAAAEGFENRPEYIRQALTADKPIVKDMLLQRGKLLQGVVVDEQNQPLQGALVAVQNNWNGDWMYFYYLGSARTNAKGEFRIWMSLDREKVIGSPHLEIVKEGYGAAMFPAQLEEQSRLLKDEPLGTIQVLPGGTIAGKVIDKDGKAVVHCRVVARDYSREIGSASTDDNGQYEIKGLMGRDTLVTYFTGRGGHASPVQGQVTVYALPEPNMDLRDAVKYTTYPTSGETVQASDLVIGSQTVVAGKLLSSKTPLPMAGLLVRLDYDWGDMVPADGQGNFRFGNVPPGKHVLAAYLPNNLRGDRGIGRTKVDVKQGASLDNVTIQLDELVEVRVQFLNSQGEGLEGISAGATWDKRGDGFWMEGTKSDKDGFALLYLYPGQTQYVRGFDHTGDLVSEGFVELSPKVGQAVKSLRIVMVHAASLRGVLQDSSHQPISQKEFLCLMKYADGTERREPIKTDAAGAFKLERLTPGAVSLSFETRPAQLEGQRAQMEIKPGAEANAGAVVLSPAKRVMISGRLVASPTFSSLEGFKIRLDLEEWAPMLATDEQGRFAIPAKPGKHRLTAYLPYNGRTDRGVGHVEVEAGDDGVKDVKLPLETLSTVHMRIVDPSGKPLEGISAAAWWTPDHSGVFTEGTKSDSDGMATLYMYPGEDQFVGAHDWSGKYRLKADRPLKPEKGQVIKDLTVAMLPADTQE